MDKKAFKDEYLADAFFFVRNEYEFTKLQEVAIEFGRVCKPTGKPHIIEYDLYNVSRDIAPVKGVKVAKNLTFFSCGSYQKSSFWVRGASYGEPKDFKSFIRDYELVNA